MNIFHVQGILTAVISLASSWLLAPRYQSPGLSASGTEYAGLYMDRIHSVPNVDEMALGNVANEMWKEAIAILDENITASDPGDWPLHW